MRYNFIVEENNKKYIPKEDLRNEIKSAIDISKSNLFGNSEEYQNIILGFIINYSFDDNPKFVFNNHRNININGKIYRKNIYRNLKRKFTDNNLSDIDDNISIEDSENNLQLDQKWMEYELVSIELLKNF